VSTDFLRSLLGLNILWPGDDGKYLFDLRGVFLALLQKAERTP